MPRFYFDFHGDGEAGVDTEGCEFESFELACLDAFETMVRVGAEQLLERRGDPSTRWIDIRDVSHRILLTMPFDEVFCRKPMRPLCAGEDNGGGRRTRHYTQLNEQIVQAHARAEASLENARRTLARVEARRVKMHLGW